MGYFTHMASKPFLYDLGFEYGEDSGPRGESGYTIVVRHGLETLWITFDNLKNILYLYNEYICGGMLWDKEINVPIRVLTDKYNFAKWLDTQIDFIW